MRKGFTLLELLIVIGVMGIVAAIVIPKCQDDKPKSDIYSIPNCSTIYKVDVPNKTVTYISSEGSQHTIKDNWVMYKTLICRKGEF